jgi:tRNA1(Val) A37 N6-methylase TrmN6
MERIVRDPDSYVPISPDGSGAIERLFGRDLLRLDEPVRLGWIEHAFNYWRGRGFPFPTLSESEIHSEYLRIVQTQPNTVLHDGTLRFSSVGLRLANAFHPQMWSVRLHDHARSPIEYFADDQVLRKALGRATHFWPNRRCWNAQCVRSTFRVYAGGRVANFRPSAARALISTFSPPGGTILDFSAGYGGRLLGAISLPRLYIGIDPEPEQHKGLQALWSALVGMACGQAHIHCARAESFFDKVPSSSVDMVISSPPYFSQERYSSHSSQSCVRYSNYLEWKTGFLYIVLAHCQRVLKPGGYLVINVKDTRNYKVASDAKHLLDKLLEPIVTIRLTMTARPQQRASSGPMYGHEPILVYRKKTKRAGLLRTHAN